MNKDWRKQVAIIVREEVEYEISRGVQGTQRKEAEKWALWEQK